MILDVECAFLYRDMKRGVYIELPMEDEMRLGSFVGKLDKATYGARDAAHIWQETVERTMVELGFKVSMLHPAVYYHVEITYSRLHMRVMSSASARREASTGCIASSITIMTSR
jgi:hypothetical protein